MLAILLLSPAELVRISIKVILRAEYREVTFGDAANASQALASLAKRRWKLAIIDDDLMDQQGCCILQHLREAASPASAIVIGPHDRPDIVARARCPGAAGFLPKEVRRSELLRAVGTVLVGKTYFSASVEHVVDQELHSTHLELSPQEQVVLQTRAS